MNGAVHVVLGMPNECVIETFRAEVVIRAVFVGVNVRALLDTVSNDLVYAKSPVARRSMFWRKPL
jgi:hypothetical protein